MMPFTKQHSAYAWVVTCILLLINLTFHNLPLHSSYKIHQPITDYFLRLPYSELLEKRFFRSRANRRLVFRPTPSWLSPGRSTSWYLPENELVISMHARHKRQASKEGDCGPVHSSMSIPRPRLQKHKTKAKPNQNQTNTKQNQKPNTKKTTNTKPGHEGILTRLEKWLRHLVCHALYWPSKQSKTSKRNTKSRWPPEVRESNMPTPVIRILLAGGRTTNVEHNAIRILLAGGRTTQVEHFAIRILLAAEGRRQSNAMPSEYY